jgi:hypothetical protein
MSNSTSRMWNKATATFPPQGTEVEITHPQFIGTRSAVLANCIGFMGWRLTDCVHPAQNAFVPLEGSGWRYLQGEG